MATAAYEHEEDAAPNPLAIAMLFTPASGSKRDRALVDTRRSTMAENKKPRHKPQKICHSMKNAIRNGDNNRVFKLMDAHAIPGRPRYQGAGSQRSVGGIRPGIAGESASHLA